jgi:hypothetical protein
VTVLAIIYFSGGDVGFWSAYFIGRVWHLLLAGFLIPDDERLGGWGLVKAALFRLL